MESKAERAASPSRLWVANEISPPVDTPKKKRVAAKKRRTSRTTAEPTTEQQTEAAEAVRTAAPNAEEATAKAVVVEATDDRVVAAATEATKPRPASVTPARVARTEEVSELAMCPRDHWSEARVTECLCTHTGVLPTLLRVIEMHARLRGSHKFLCVFQNAAEEECNAWLSDVLLFRYYREQYDEIKKMFVAAVAR